MTGRTSLKASGTSWDQWGMISSPFCICESANRYDRSLNVIRHRVSPTFLSNAGKRCFQITVQELLKSGQQSTLRAPVSRICSWKWTFDGKSTEVIQTWDFWQREKSLTSQTFPRLDKVTSKRRRCLDIALGYPVLKVLNNNFAPVVLRIKNRKGLFATCWIHLCVDLSLSPLNY